MNTLKSLRFLIEQQDYQCLSDRCKEALQTASRAEILPLYSLALAQLGKFPPARQILDQAEAAYAELDNDARLDLGAAYMVLFELDKALDCIQTCLSEQPDHAIGLARLGLCYTNKGELEKAQSALEKSLAIEGHRLAVINHLLSVYLQQQKYQHAAPLLQRGLYTLAEQQEQLKPALYQQYDSRLRAMQCQYWVHTEDFSQAESWLASVEQDQDEDDYAYWLSVYATKLAEKDLHGQAEEMLRDGLKRYPHNQHLLLQLVELAELQGHMPQAIYLLKGMLQHAADDEPGKCSGLWAKLATIYSTLDETEAKTAADKAMALASDLTVTEDYPAERIAALRLQAKNALALVESATQNYTEAETLFNQILSKNPHHIPALKGLGQQYLQQGKIEESIQLFERVKLIDPIIGYTALISARQFPEDIDTLEKLDKAARIPSIEGSVRVGILFQLAAAFEKRQDYDQAFAYAQEANGLNQRFLHYDKQAHRNYCARIRYAFSPSLYQHRQNYGVDSSLPVYVLGMPRSGTTLVEQIIASHSQIFGAGELGVIPSRIQGLNRWERHVGSGREFPDCVDDISPQVAAGIAEDILKELQAYAPTAKHVVDKLPHNFENIGFIKFLFPRAKIISVRRDPRDIAISNYFTDYQAKHGGMGFAYDLSHIGEQLADHNLLMHHWQQVFPGDILEIKYEDVVENTEAAARQLLNYIGVDWEPQVLDFNQLDRPVKTASVWQVRQPIYKTSKAKWMRYQAHLGPLIEGTNAKISWDPIRMITLPEPGLQTTGAELFNQGDLDGAELACQKMLHFNSDHGAANYLVGLIYCRKGIVNEGITYLEAALKKCPWQQEWRAALELAYEANGQTAKAE